MAAAAGEAVARVLVVDDDETIRTALSRFLRSRGYAVTAVGSAADALAALDRDRCDVALCDVRMPGMTGMELLPIAIKKDPDLAVVMLTAVNDAPTATEALALGASDYLVKPVELQDLQQAVERALHRRGLLREQGRVERLVRDEVALRTSELEREQAALRQLTVEERLPARPFAACRRARRVHRRRTRARCRQRRSRAPRRPSARHRQDRHARIRAR
jgi:DNA-binding NtrC family response regulator